MNMNMTMVDLANFFKGSRVTFRVLKNEKKNGEIKTHKLFMVQASDIRSSNSSGNPFYRNKEVIKMSLDKNNCVINVWIKEKEV